MQIENIVKKFLAETIRKHGHKSVPGILAACSGGPDSVALIHILRQLSEELKFRLVIGHVNHRLRGAASEGDEEFVKTLGKNLGLTVYVTRMPRKYANTRHTSEETSRNFRYAALTHMARKAGCAFVATAHTQDDQAETVLMNMIRGAGTLGLCGMPPAIPLESANLALIRPFLEVSHPKILNYLKSNHLPYRTDKTNFSLKYTRNWIRHKLLPLLERKNPQIKLHLAQTATILQAEERFWRSLIKKEIKGRKLDLRRFLKYPIYVKRRVVRHIAGSSLTFSEVERVIWLAQFASNGKKLTLRGGIIVTRYPKYLEITHSIINRHEK